MHPVLLTMIKINALDTLVFYIDDQNLDLQRDALNKAGCNTIYEEGASGKTLAELSLNSA